MLLDIIKLIKDHIGKCGNCNKRFIGWEHNWDGAIVLNLCKSCHKEKRFKEEKEFKENFENAKKSGKQVFTATKKLVGWTYQGEFYENPDFVSEFDPNIDDEIRQKKRKGRKNLTWEPQKFAALQEFVARHGFKEQVWDKKEFTYMGVRHRLKT